uniref:Uncharacterized protein n=1 Tax=Candidatus Kentrum sp. FW TaxID=2126338 RepID=A0A450SN93_9GAMM|nr:MAG: hypothetical protein BECKFW1821A_GA0114235_10535 [Candidatus Kentron sp. FW]VFJ61581.1 MAG: hypothetical protein BECKFW1821B_GA0114236_106612 [Candidatus Kentron sp. FW]
MKWRSFIQDGNRYHLTHLNPFDWHYRVKTGKGRSEWVCKFQVTSSMHCFTREPFPEEEVARNMWYEGPREKRVFCFERYELSLQLPGIIRTLGERKCYSTPRGNFFAIEPVTLNGEKAEYEVYFRIPKATKRTMRHSRLNLHVQSAYARTGGYETSQPKKTRLDLGEIARKKLHGR